MNNLEKELCEVMYNFVKKHIEEVAKNLSLRGYMWDYLGAKNEDDLLDQIKSTPDIAAWALTELCSWGMDKDYCKELFTEEDYVYKINNYLFSYDAKEGIITEVNKKVNKNYLWIARDSNGELWGYDHKPIKKDGIFQSDFELDKCLASELPVWLFPEVTFENSPQQVEIKLIENEK